MRVDGWGYVQRLRDAQAGYITTIPLKHDGGELVVNGSGLDRVQVEVRTADNTQPVPGFVAAASSFSAQDSTKAKVAWKGASPLAPGSYRLRFILSGVEAKLYSFGFEQSAESHA
jgi:hypothetical protein